MITLAETQDNVPETSFSLCFRHVFGFYNIRGYASLRLGNVLFQNVAFVYVALSFVQFRRLFFRFPF